MFLKYAPICPILAVCSVANKVAEVRLIAAFDSSMHVTNLSTGTDQMKQAAVW